MSRVFFATALDTAAQWWRIYRRDGVTLGFTTHDHDLWFDGLLHRAAPGMLPSAIRHTASFEDDESEVEGAITHGAVREDDLSAGRFDGARIESGIIDWQTLERASLYGGSIAAVSREAGGFSAQLRSAKADLDIDPVPLTSPTCRARFCGPGCTVNAARFEVRARIVAVDETRNRVTLDLADHTPFALGRLRLLDGAQTGTVMRVLSASAEGLILHRPLDGMIATGQRVRLLQGCDHTIATCTARFGNAVNFRGEPFLPGNDMLAQYPQPR